MRLKQTVKILVPALGLSFALGAHAQSDDMRKGTPGMEGSSRPTTAPHGAAMQRQAGDMRLSKLIGKDVHDAQGKEIGEISDLIVDASNGRVRYAIVSYGGFLGLGENQFAQPLSSFKRDAGNDRLVLNIDQARLKNAPSFERNNWPDWSRADYSSRVDQFWGTGDGGTTPRTAATTNQRYVRASQLLDADVELANGDDVGDIEDVVVNMNDGSVHYVVLDFDRNWSLDDKLVALPMSAFRPKDGGDDLILVNSNREQLRAAPAFDKNRWPSGNDRDFYSRIERWQQTYGGERSSAAPGADDRGGTAAGGTDSRTR